MALVDDLQVLRGSLQKEGPAAHLTAALDPGGWLQVLVRHGRKVKISHLQRTKPHGSITAHWEPLPVASRAQRLVAECTERRFWRHTALHHALGFSAPGGSPFRLPPPLPARGHICQQGASMGGRSDGKKPTPDLWMPLRHASPSPRALCCVRSRPLPGPLSWTPRPPTDPLHPHPLGAQRSSPCPPSTHLHHVLLVSGIPQGEVHDQRQHHGDERGTRESKDSWLHA